MDPLVDALTALSEAPDAFEGLRPASPRHNAVELAEAPACVQRLAAAMAARYYHVVLGEFALFDDNDAYHRVESLADAIGMAADAGGIELGEVLPAGFDPDHTLQLGADGGGMSQLGLTWSGATVRFLVVELEGA